MHRQCNGRGCDGVCEDKKVGCARECSLGQGGSARNEVRGEGCERGRDVREGTREVC